MRNILGLIVGGVSACFVILFITAGLSSGNPFMDRQPGEGSSVWPLLIALPLGIGFGFLVGERIARKPSDEE